MLFKWLYHASIVDNASGSIFDGKTGFPSNIIAVLLFWPVNKQVRFIYVALSKNKLHNKVLYKVVKTWWSQQKHSHQYLHCSAVLDKNMAKTEGM